MNCTDCMSRNGYCPQDCKMTNFDRVRSMTVEELAELLLGKQCDVCDWQGYCDETEKCKDQLINWLNQEVVG